MFDDGHRDGKGRLVAPERAGDDTVHALVYRRCLRGQLQPYAASNVDIEEGRLD